MKNNPRIIFFGNERLATGITKTDAPILNGLLSSGYNVVAIASHAPTGQQSRKKQTLEVAEIAAAHDIPYFSSSPRQIADQLTDLNPDIAVLASYGHIIPQSIIDIFPKGIINIHPSLLPRYRGSSPIESALLKGDTATGVSLMLLTAGMDEGPIIAQQTLKIAPDESKNSLYKRLSHTGAELLLDTLPAILAGSATYAPQDSGRATYTSRIKKSDGSIDWNNSAVSIERSIRAFYGWPGSKTTLGAIDVTITDASAIDSSYSVNTEPGSPTIHPQAPYLTVATKDGAIAIETLQPAGKKEMPVKAFLAGYKNNISA